MDNYKLKPEEVVFYKGDVTLKGKKGNTELLFTNLNVVFINKYKRLFSKEEITVFTYPTNEIKMYEGVPQIKHKGNEVEIYFKDAEVEFEFDSRIQVSKFINETNKFLTGESTVQKGAKKVKDTIGMVDDTLGINTVQATGNVIKNGVVGNITGAIGKIGSLFKKKK